MNKSRELLEVLAELKQCNEALVKISGWLSEVLVAGMNAEEKQEAEAPPQPPQLELSDVRAVLAKKSSAGHTAEVRELLAKHGVKKLSEIDPEEYPALLAEAEAIGHAG